MKVATSAMSFRSKTGYIIYVYYPQLETEVYIAEISMVGVIHLMAKFLLMRRITKNFILSPIMDTKKIIG